MAARPQESDGVLASLKAQKEGVERRINHQQKIVDLVRQDATIQTEEERRQQIEEAEKTQVELRNQLVDLTRQIQQIEAPRAASSPVQDFEFPPPSAVSRESEASRLGGGFSDVQPAAGTPVAGSISPQATWVRVNTTTKPSETQIEILQQHYEELDRSPDDALSRQFRETYMAVAKMPEGKRIISAMLREQRPQDLDALANYAQLIQQNPDLEPRQSARVFWRNQYQEIILPIIKEKKASEREAVLNQHYAELPDSASRQRFRKAYQEVAEMPEGENNIHAVLQKKSSQDLSRLLSFAKEVAADPKKYSGYNPAFWAGQVSVIQGVMAEKGLISSADVQPAANPSGESLDDLMASLGTPAAKQPSVAQLAAAPSQRWGILEKPFSSLNQNEKEQFEKAYYEALSSDHGKEFIEAAFLKQSPSDLMLLQQAATPIVNNNEMDPFDPKKRVWGDIGRRVREHQASQPAAAVAKRSVEQIQADLSKAESAFMARDRKAIEAFETDASTKDKCDMIISCLQTADSLLKERAKIRQELSSYDPEQRQFLEGLLRENEKKLPNLLDNIRSDINFLITNLSILIDPNNPTVLLPAFSSLPELMMNFHDQEIISRSSLARHALLDDKVDRFINPLPRNADIADKMDFLRRGQVFLANEKALRAQIALEQNPEVKKVLETRMDRIVENVKTQAPRVLAEAQAHFNGANKNKWSDRYIPEREVSALQQEVNQQLVQSYSALGLPVSSPAPQPDERRTRLEAMVGYFQTRLPTDIPPQASVHFKMEYLRQGRSFLQQRDALLTQLQALNLNPAEAAGIRGKIDALSTCLQRVVPEMLQDLPAPQPGQPDQYQAFRSEFAQLTQFYIAQGIRPAPQPEPEPGATTGHALNNDTVQKIVAKLKVSDPGLTHDTDTRSGQRKDIVTFSDQKVLTIHANTGRFTANDNSDAAIAKIVAAAKAYKELPGNQDKVFRIDQGSEAAQQKLKTSLEAAGVRALIVPQPGLGARPSAPSA